MSFSVKQLLRLWAVPVMITALYSCASTSQAPVSNAPLEGPVNTGTYPHFTPDPKGETAQFTEQQKADLTKRLAAAKQRQAGPSADPTLVGRTQSELKKVITDREAELKAAGQLPQ